MLLRPIGVAILAWHNMVVGVLVIMFYLYAVGSGLPIHSALTRVFGQSTSQEPALTINSFGVAEPVGNPDINAEYAGLIVGAALFGFGLALRTYRPWARYVAIGGYSVSALSGLVTGLWPLAMVMAILLVYLFKPSVRAAFASNETQALTIIGERWHCPKCGAWALGEYCQCGLRRAALG